MRTSLIVSLFVIALSEQAVAQCGFVLWMKRVVDMRKGELTREPAEWSSLDGYDDIRECRAHGAAKIKGRERFWIYQGMGFTFEVTSERSVVFANKEEQTGVSLDYLCFPANFDPRK